MIEGKELYSLNSSTEKIEMFFIEDFIEDNRKIVEEFQCQCCRMIYLKPILLGNK